MAKTVSVRVHQFAVKVVPDLLWRSMGEAISTFFGSVPNLDYRVFPEGWVVSTGEPVVDMNCAAVYARGIGRETFMAIHDVLAARDAPFMISMSEEAAPSLEADALALGLRPGGPVSVMCFQPFRLPIEAPRDGLTIVRATDPACLDGLANLACEIFGLPHESVGKVFTPGLLASGKVSIYAAYRYGEPVGIAVLSHHPQTVGIWCMGVSPKHRREGIGSRLLIQAMSENLEDNPLFFLLPTPQGKLLYEQIGFRTVAYGQAWTNPP